MKRERRARGRGRISLCCAAAPPHRRATASAQGPARAHKRSCSAAPHWLLLLLLLLRGTCCHTLPLPQLYVRFFSFGSAAVPRSHSSLLVEMAAAKRSVSWDRQDGLEERHQCRTKDFATCGGGHARDKH